MARHTQVGALAGARADQTATCAGNTIRQVKLVPSALISMVLALSATALPPTAASADSALATAAYRPLTPCRLLDTREERRTKPTGSESLSLAVRGQCGVAVDASAVAITVTVTEAAGAGFITAWPSGEPMPLASTANYLVGETRANAALLSLGADGNLALFASNSVHIVIDISGEFFASPAVASGRFVAIAPVRAIDTQANAGSALALNGSVDVALPAGVPADATAMEVTITATRAPAAGFVTAYPTGTVRPFVSMLNTDAPRQTRTATQIVPVTANGLTVFSNAGGHLVVDVVGYFTGPSAPATTDGLFVPSAPKRVLDTREAVRVYAGGAIAIDTAAAVGSVAAVAANITATEAGPSGYLTAWAAQTEQPPTPALTYEKRGEDIANLGVVSVSTAGLAVASTSGAHVVVDITGWFVGTPLPTTAAAPLNTAPVRVNPTAPIGCLTYVPTPTSDGLYVTNIGKSRIVAHTYTAGPKGPIVVIGDSLTYGAALRTIRGLRANGWGPICYDAQVARSITYSTTTRPSGLATALRIKTSDPVWNDPTITWMVGLGTNDVVSTGTNTMLARAHIDRMLTAIGPNPIWWVNVHTANLADQPRERAFNAAIASTGVHVIDWATFSTGAPWFAGDLVHLSPTGYNARASFVVSSVHGW